MPEAVLSFLRSHDSHPQYVCIIMPILQMGRLTAQEVKELFRAPQHG